METAADSPLVVNPARKSSHGRLNLVNSIQVPPPFLASNRIGSPQWHGQQCPHQYTSPQGELKLPRFQGPDAVSFFSQKPFFACGLLARNAVAILSHGASGSDSYELRPRPLREQTHHASLKVCMDWTGRQMTSYSEITIWSSECFQ